MTLGLSLEYIAGFTLWVAVLGATPILALKLRRKWRKKHPARVHVANLLLSAWPLLVLLTFIEFFFAFIYNQSDSFNITLVSQRWFARHVEPFRNSDGFRDSHGLPRTLPDGVRHICFFGDSFTMGHGVRRMEDRFSDIIADEFERRRPGEFVVSNAAEAGYDILQVRGTIAAFVKHDRPIHVAVYVYTLNDIQSHDPRNASAMKPVVDDSPRFWLFTETYSWNWFYCRYRQFTWPQIADYYPHLRESYESPAWDALTVELDGIAELCRDNGIDLRIAIFPFVHNLGPNYPFQEAHVKLDRFCRSLGIPMLDLTGDLEPHAHQGLVVNRFDAHPNEIAHRVAARSIRDKLLNDLLVVGKPADH